MPEESPRILQLGLKHPRIQRLKDRRVSSQHVSPLGLAITPPLRVSRLNPVPSAAPLLPTETLLVPPLQAATFQCCRPLSLLAGPFELQ